MSYLPYISDCNPVFGSFLPINALFLSESCELESDPKSVELFGAFDDVKGDKCSFKLLCDYNLDINFMKRPLRWYETVT